jgi:hypothetical protein
MSEYAFDVTLKIAIRVDAPTEQDARKLLDRHLDCADANFGAWPSGDPILAEASMWGRPRVYEIDQEAYEPGHGTDEYCIRRAEDDGAVFKQNENKLWSVGNNNKLWEITNVATLAGAARVYGAVRRWENQKVRRWRKQQLQTRKLTPGRVLNEG